jgi:aspartate ammonia-lyase
MINAVSIFRTELVDGITADEERCRQWLEDSLCLATALAPYVGHEKAAGIMRTARSEGKTIAEVAVEKGYFSAEEIGAIFTSRELTRPGIAGSNKVKRQDKKK